MIHFNQRQGKKLSNYTSSRSLSLSKAEAGGASRSGFDKLSRRYTQFLRYTCIVTKLNGQRPFLIFALILFVATALFPFGWLATVWPGFNAAANFVFGTQISHIVGHFTVFMMMGAGVLALFPSLRRRFWLYFGLLLLFGLLQEFLQIASFKHIVPAFDELLDLTMDMLGAVVIFYLWNRKS